MQYVQFVIHGVTPLLLHSPKAMEPQATLGGRKEIPTPEAEAERGAYRLPDGSLAFPATGVRNAAIKGASGMRVNRKSARPYLAGSLLLLDRYFPILDGDGVQVKEYQVDTQRAVVQRQGILRSRPRIDVPWQVAAVFIYNPLLAEAAFMRLLSDSLAEAGRIVGIGDYRIEKLGGYGAFLPGAIRIEGDPSA